MAVGEKPQDIRRVVTDRREPKTLLFEPRDRALQLDQLPLAERSPIRRTEKQEYGSVRSLQRFQGSQIPKLIAQRKRRRFLPNP